MTYNERRKRALETMDECLRRATEFGFSIDPPDLAKAQLYAQLGILRGLCELLETEQME